MTGKFIKSLLLGMLAAMSIWVIASFAEVNAHNLDHMPRYSEVNVFRLVSGYQA